jgi:hypothetical protein
MAQQSDPSTLVDGVLAAAAHLEPELEEALAEHHLSRPSFQVLSALLDAEGQALTQRELMAQVRRTSGTMSVRLARLERAGLVTREPDTDDRRSVTVTERRSSASGSRVTRPARSRRVSRTLIVPEVRRTCAISSRWVRAWPSASSSAERTWKLGRERWCSASASSSSGSRCAAAARTPSTRVEGSGC